MEGANGARIRDRLSDGRSNLLKIASLDALWYVADTVMNRFGRILGALLALTTLTSTAFGRANIICVESSGRISFGCDDMVPDELRVGSIPLELQLGSSSQDCGFCHDYIVGQTVTQSIHVSALPVPAIRQLDVLSHPISPVEEESKPVPVLDSSGSISPLKC